jgi:hypothetical protein
MPPKSKKAEPGDPGLEPLFTSIGLSASRTKNVLQSARSSESLAKVIRLCSLENAGFDEKTAGLIVEVTAEADAASPKGQEERLTERDIKYLVEAIKAKELKSAEQVKGKCWSCA